MAWRVQYTRTFLKEMSCLSGNVRGRVEAVVFGNEIAQDTFLAGKTQKLSGYQTFYRFALAIIESVCVLMWLNIWLTLSAYYIGAIFTENFRKERNCAQKPILCAFPSEK